MPAAAAADMGHEPPARSAASAGGTAAVATRLAPVVPPADPAAAPSAQAAVQLLLAAAAANTWPAPAAGTGEAGSSQTHRSPRQPATVAVTATSSTADPATHSSQARPRRRIKPETLSSSAPSADRGSVVNGVTTQRPGVGQQKAPAATRTGELADRTTIINSRPAAEAPTSTFGASMTRIQPTNHSASPELSEPRVQPWIAAGKDLAHNECLAAQLRQVVEASLSLLRSFQQADRSTHSERALEARMVAAAMVSEAVPLWELLAPGALNLLRHSAQEWAAVRPLYKQALKRSEERQRRAKVAAEAYSQALSACLLARSEGSAAGGSARSDQAYDNRLRKLQVVIDNVYRWHGIYRNMKEFGTCLRNELFYTASRAPQLRPSDYGPFAELLVASLSDPTYSVQMGVGAEQSLAAHASLQPAMSGLADNGMDGTAHGNGQSPGRSPRRPLATESAAAAGGGTAATAAAAADRPWGGSTPLMPATPDRGGAASLDYRMRDVWPHSLEQASYRQRQVCKSLLLEVRDVGLWLAMLMALRNAIDQASTTLGGQEIGSLRREDSRLLQLVVCGDMLAFLLNHALVKVGGVAFETQGRFFAFHADLVAADACLDTARSQRRLLAALSWICPFYAALVDVRAWPPYPALRAKLEDLWQTLLPKMLGEGNRVAAALCGLLDMALHNNKGLDEVWRNGLAGTERSRTEAPAGGNGGLAESQMAAKTLPALDDVEELITDRVLQTFNPWVARVRTELLRGEARRINPELQTDTSVRPKASMSAREAQRQVGANRELFLEQVLASVAHNQLQERFAQNYLEAQQQEQWTNIVARRLMDAQGGHRVDIFLKQQLLQRRDYMVPSEAEVRAGLELAITQFAPRGDIESAMLWASEDIAGLAATQARKVLERIDNWLKNRLEAAVETVVRSIEQQARQRLEFWRETAGEAPRTPLGKSPSKVLGSGDSGGLTKGESGGSAAILVTGPQAGRELLKPLQASLELVFTGSSSQELEQNLVCHLTAAQAVLSKEDVILGDALAAATLLGQLAALILQQRATGACLSYLSAWKAMLLEVWADLVKRFSAPSLAEAMLEELLKLHQGLLPFYLAPGDCALMVDIFQPLLADADATLCAAAKLSQALGSCVTQMQREQAQAIIGELWRRAKDLPHSAMALGLVLDRAIDQASDDLVVDLATQSGMGGVGYSILLARV